VKKEMEPVDITNAEHYNLGDQCDGWHMLKTVGLSVIQERVPSRAAEIMHYHEHAYQFFYVLVGTATLELRDQCFTLHPGQGMAVPPNHPHRLVNNTDIDLSFLVISSPMSHGDRVLV
jgi:mannose-6-phosphate isomerase-like protein (cupin superfamily)